jgi:hypothetical protein
MRCAFRTFWFVLISTAIASAADEDPVALQKGVRGLVTLASQKVTVDGDLGEWYGAFCTPVHYNHVDLVNRATQVYYLWDNDALYIGLRALDKKRANIGTKGSLWNGDAVEFYLDTRQGAGLRGKDWTKGAVHLFFTPFEGTEVRPRWEMRGGIATSDTVLEGVEIAAKAKDWGYELEFKVPWANFPEFHPNLGSLLACDVEVCSSDGAARTDRTFSYGSPLSVQQPASQGTVELVRTFDPTYFEAVGPAAFPMWVDTPWVQDNRAQVQAVVAIAPALAEIVGEVTVRIHDPDGKVVKSIPAPIERFGPKDANFVRAVARWSIDEFAPNTYFATANVDARTGKTITKVAPRLVHEAQMSGR